MATKTAIGVATAVLLIAGSVVVINTKNDPEGSGSDVSQPAPAVSPGRNVVRFVVTYTDRPEHVIYTVAGADTQVPRNFLPSDGFVHEIPYVPGTAYQISAYQARPGHLECQTAVNNIEVDHKSRDDAGSVRCYVNRAR
jgi:hypothetical protein